MIVDKKFNAAVLDTTVSYGWAGVLRLLNASGIYATSARLFSTRLHITYLDVEMQATVMQEWLKQLTKGMPSKEPLSIFTPDCQDLTDRIPDIGMLQI